MSAASLSAASFAIRYRSALHPDSVTLIVEDPTGGHFILSCRPDHCRLTPLNDIDPLAPTLLHLGWQPVPDVARYPLAALRSLMTGAINTHHLPPFLALPHATPPEQERQA